MVTPKRQSRVSLIAMRGAEEWRRLRLGQRLFRTTLAVSLGVVVWLFVRLLGAQNSSFDVNGKFDSNVAEGKLLPIDSWQLTFFECENTGEETGSCLPIGKEGESTAIKFPGADTLPKIVEALPSKPTKVIARHKLSQAERTWLALKPQNSLVLPRSVQNRVRAMGGGGNAEFYGVGANATFSLRSRDVLDQGELALEFDILELDWFGPADMAIVLARSEAVDEYLSSTLKLQFANNLAHQMEIGFPVLLAAVAIVLDHSAVFGLASLYGVMRAARSFINYAYIEGLLESAPWNQSLLYACNGLVFGILLIFTLEICGLRAYLKSWMLWLVAVVGAIGSCVWGYFDPQFSVTSDLWADALSASLGIPLVVTGCVLAVLRARRKETQKNEDFANLGRVLFFARAVLLLVGFGIHAWANWQELGKISAHELRNPLDWKHSMLFPVLITVALFEVGSVARKMVGFAKTMAEGALLEQEVALARDMQQRMLPARKHGNDLWQWRAFYYPASALAGDWFDVRELTFADGVRYLAVCVVDITGHGVGPALVTSTLCSQWSLWCMDIQTQAAPTSSELKQTMLSEGAFRMHNGLRALGKNDACTAVLSLFDPITGELTYTTCGHPGVLVQNPSDGKIKYCRTAGGGLGVTANGEKTAASWPAGTATLEVDARVCLYSDGLVPLDVPLTTWLRQIERALKKSDEPLIKNLTRQLRDNKRAFRSRPGEEDDITLVVIHQKSLLSEKTSVPKQDEISKNGDSEHNDPVQDAQLLPVPSAG